MNLLYNHHSFFFFYIGFEQFSWIWFWDVGKDFSIIGWLFKHNIPYLDDIWIGGVTLSAIKTRFFMNEAFQLVIRIF